MTIPHHIKQKFPVLSDTLYKRRLSRPKPHASVLIDTDTANEIDDQYALAWTLLSADRLNLVGVTAEPFSFAHHRDGLIENYNRLKQNKQQGDTYLLGAESKWEERLVAQNIDPKDLVFTTVEQGAELSYQEILQVFKKCHKDPTGLVYRGSTQYLEKFATPVDNDAVQFIIKQARIRDDDDPLYILAMGVLTNVASALLIAPDIIEKIVVVWTSAFPSYAPFNNRPSLNLVQDIYASHLIYACGVPHVYLPGYMVGAQLKISLPEMEQFVKGQGDIGDYLHYLYTHNPLHKLFAVTNPETKTWVIWDIINVAWMLDSRYVSTFMTTSPLLADNLQWHHPKNAHPMCEAYDINRDAIFEDFYMCLQNNAT